MKAIIAFIFSLGVVCAAAQTTPTLSAFNQDRLSHQRNAMFVLGGWAVGNMAVGGILMGQTQGTDRYFHQMNLAWNTVNLGIAAAGFFGLRKTSPESFSLYQTIEEQHRFQQVLLLNAGLDVGYILGGLYLTERSKSANNPQHLKGYGNSIIFQGAFLLLFDTTNFFIGRRRNVQIQPLLSGLSIQIPLNNDNYGKGVATK